MGRNRRGLRGQMIKDSCVLDIILAWYFSCFIFRGARECSEVLVIVVVYTVSKELFVLVFGI
jgi:hypothetical protein